MQKQLEMIIQVGLENMYEFGLTNLLERSRVPQLQNISWRKVELHNLDKVKGNYHIFYHFMKGTNNLKDYYL